MRGTKEELAMLAAWACAGAAVACILLVLIIAHHIQRSEDQYDISGMRHHKLLEKK